MTARARTRSLTPIAAAVTVALFASRAAAQHGAGPLNRADYELHARVSGPRTIEGRARIAWSHQSATPVRELYWHLYANAFADDRSLFRRTLTAGNHRGNAPGARGAIALHALRLSTGEDLLADAVREFNEAPGDRTQLRTPLPREVARGELVEIDATFTVTLPDAFARSGCAEGFCFAGQWFPKLAVLERDGRWESFALHAQSEFYADFGRYSLHVDAPASDAVFATGERVGDEQVRDGRRRATFVLGRAHDAAFGWSSRVRVREASAGSAIERDGDEAPEGVVARSAVTVRVIATEADERDAVRALSLVQRALPALERRYGPYPYRTLTVVVAPRDASGIGGMEYPSLVTIDPSPLAPSFIRALEYVTVHELAHQWFYGAIASDEHRHPVLDEGLTEFATGQVMEELYGPRSLGGVASLGLGFWAMQGSFSGLSSDDGPLVRDASAFAGFDAYANLVYRRTAALFASVSRSSLDAERALERALARYAREQRFRHPTPDDLVRALREEPALIDPVERLVQPALFTNSTLDLAVTSLTSERAQLTRTGALHPVVSVRIERPDGREETRRWDTRAASLTLEGPLRSVRIDPDQRLPIERERVTNARSVDGPGLTPLAARASAWIAVILQWLGP